VTEQPFDFRPFSADQRGDGEVEDFRPVRGIGIAAMILLPLVCVIELVVTLQEWRAAGLIVDVRNGAVSSAADLEDAASALTSGSVLTLGVLLAAGIVFLVWLWRARVNAERLAGRQSQRRGRGWTIGGWFCPVVNFWYPYQVVRDIYAASSPRQPVRTVVVRLWWTMWMVNVIIGDVLVRSTNSADLAQELRTRASLETLSLVFEIAAAALAIIIVRRVSEWQELSPLRREQHSA
jgi:hypothetical protein